MILTPLYERALILNQWVTDSLYLYRTPLYWNKSSRCFCRELRIYHSVPWFITNFGLIGGLWLPSSIIFLYQAFIHPKFASLIEVLVAILHVILAAEALYANVGYMFHVSDFISCLNEAVKFEEILSRQYQTRLKYKVQEDNAYLRQFGMLTNTESVWSRTIRDIHLPNGNLDYIGMVAVYLDIAYAVIPLVFPIMTVWLDFDTPYLAFQNTFLQLSFKWQVTAKMIRFFLLLICTMECCSCFSTLGLAMLLGVRSVLSVLSLLLDQPVSEFTISQLTHLSTIFAIPSQFVAGIFSFFLGTMYLLLVLSFAFGISSARDIPWNLHFFLVLLYLITVCIMVTLVYFVVEVDLGSSALQRCWLWSCAQQNASSYSRRLLYRLVRSRKPIKIPYGSLGYFKRETRTDYMSSISEKTLNVIIATGT